MALTNAQLQKKLDEANALIEKQKVELEVKTEKLQELSAAGEGWLVSTPSPLYDGVTLGIQFVRGQAFVRKSQKVSAFETKPMKKSAIEKSGMAPSEVKALREREAKSSAERAVLALENDHGYAATYFDGTAGADQQMEKVVSKRAKEYSQALEVLEAREKAEQAIAPHFMGQ